MPAHASRAFALLPLTAALSLACGQAQAQPAPPDATTLDSIQVSGDWLGSGLQNSTRNFPGARTVLKREAIGDTGASNVSDVLRRIPGIQISNNSSSGGSGISLNIGVRGLEGRYSPRSTVLLDGLPLAVAPYGQPQLSFAPLTLNNIESIDVVRGGGAVRYGPQNVGGILNFKTRAIPTEPVSGDVFVRYNDYGHGGGNRQFGTFLGGRSDNGLGLALMYSGSRGSGWREHSDESIDDVAVKFDYNLTETSQVYGKLAYFEADSDLPGGLTAAQYAQDPFQSLRNRDRWTGRRTMFDLGYLNTLSDTQEFEIRSYYSDSFRQSFFANNQDATATSISNQPRNYHVFGIEPRYTRRFETGNVAHDVTVGYRYLRERANEQNINIALSNGARSMARWSNNSTDAHSLYIDDQMRWGRWRITPGVRFERIDIGRVNQLTAFSGDVKNDEALPALNVAYVWTPELTVFANYNTSFGSIQHLQLNLGTSADRLQPEKAKTIELGARWTGDRVSAEVTVFDLRFDNQIVFVNEPPVFYRNIGKTHHNGVETSVEYRFDHEGPLAGLSAYATYAYTRALQKSGEFDGNDVPNYARDSDSLGVRYARDAWALNLSSTHQSRQFGEEANLRVDSANGANGPIAGYRVWNANASWTLPGKPGLTLEAGVNNLGDERYFTRTTDGNRGKLVAAPRTTYVQLTGTF